MSPLRIWLSIHILIPAIALICFGTFAKAQLQEILSNSTIWKDDENKNFVISDLKSQGRWIVITMSYTQCRKTCPLVTLRALRELENEFKKRDIAADFIIISFDPEHDSPKVLAEFKKKQNLVSPQWHLLTGSKDQARAIAKPLGLANYWEMDEHILHSFKVSIINPKRETVQSLDWDHRDVSQLNFQ